MKDLGLPSLQYRRTRADLIEVYKIINGIDKCDKDQLFRTQTDQRTRGHTQKIQVGKDQEKSQSERDSHSKNCLNGNSDWILASVNNHFSRTIKIV